MLTSLLWLLFDWRGRISRSTYRAGLLMTVLLNEAVTYGTDAPQTTRFVLTALSVVIVLALEAKRFHDIGRSAAWILWVNLATLPIGLLIRAAVPDIFDLVDVTETLPVIRLLPEVWFVQGALLGLALGSSVKGLWLSFAPSTKDESAYAPVARENAPRANHGLSDALDRAIAERGSGPLPQPAAAVADRPSPGAPASHAPQRSFGKRGLHSGT